MITWPQPKLTPPVVRDNLVRFAATSFARELERDPNHRWTFETWPWSTAAPARFTVRDQELEEIEFVMEEDGTWRVTEAPTLAHVRLPSDVPVEFCADADKLTDE